MAKKFLLSGWMLIFSLSAFGQMYDVIFSELMVKPAPVVGLPNVEYVELYNRTDSLIRLKNWTLKIGNSNRTLPDSVILPKSYLLICANAKRLPEEPPALKIPYRIKMLFLSLKFSSKILFTTKIKSWRIFHHRFRLKI